MLKVLVSNNVIWPLLAFFALIIALSGIIRKRSYLSLVISIAYIFIASVMVLFSFTTEKGESYPFVFSLLILFFIFLEIFFAAVFILPKENVKTETSDE